MIAAENLAEEKGQGSQQAEDSVAGLADLLPNDLRNPPSQRDLAEGQLGIKDQRAEQGSELSECLNDCGDKGT